MKEPECCRTPLRFASFLATSSEDDALKSAAVYSAVRIGARGTSTTAASAAAAAETAAGAAAAEAVAAGAEAGFLSAGAAGAEFAGRAILVNVAAGVSGLSNRKVKFGNSELFSNVIVDDLSDENRAVKSTMLICFLNTRADVTPPSSSDRTPSNLISCV